MKKSLFCIIHYQGDYAYNINKWNLHGGKTTMLYLNLSGHDIFKTRFGTSPEKHCLTATPYRLFQSIKDISSVDEERIKEAKIVREQEVERKSS